MLFQSPLLGEAASCMFLLSATELATATIPLARIGSAEEAAGAILFLASPWSTYMTGQVIPGGLLLHALVACPDSIIAIVCSVTSSHASGHHVQMPRFR
jgi:NAD(P)-dependent dehydrogenase (short-subunit alcohol dehydrogenase family)